VVGKKVFQIMKPTEEKTEKKLKSKLRRNTNYLMLTGKQRSHLRRIANSIQPIFQIGKGGIDENVIAQFDEALEARELVKATVLKNSEIDVKTSCEYIAEQTEAEIVQIIGNRFVLYRESKNNKNITLP